MNALFLKDLADKTRRGLRGRVEQGKSGGGNSYGYDVVRAIDAGGDVQRGERKINEAEAEVVRRILRDYASGKSAKRIAVELNRDRIPAPSGGEWGFSTINGNPKRGTGILNNEMYIGKIVWNRQRFLKDPISGKRQARPNAESEWIVQEVPELRLVDDALWQVVKSRQEGNRETKSAGGDKGETFRDRTRPRYLLSGLLKCGVCGGGYSAISKDHLGCSNARNKGTCGNRVNIRRDVLEHRVLLSLQKRMMNAEMFGAFCQTFTEAMNRKRMAARAAIDAARAEVRKIDRDLDMLVEMLLRGGGAERLNTKMVSLEARKRDLEATLVDAVEPPPLLHPEMASFYRRQVEAMVESLGCETEAQRMTAAESLRSLVEQIILTPAKGEIEIDVKGDLAAILRIATNAKGPAANAVGFLQVEMVAGKRKPRYRHLLTTQI